MPENTKFHPGFESEKNVELVTQRANLLKLENQKLILENNQFKKNLESEQLLHSTLYKEWKQLKKADIFKEAELLHYKTAPRQLISKAAFSWLVIIASLLAVMALYNFFLDRKDKSKSLSKVTTPTSLILPLKHQNQLTN